MRLAGLLLTLTFSVAGAGCSNKGDANNAPDPAALKAQQDLMARREALTAERKKLETERAAIDTKIEQVKAQGGDVADLENKRADLSTKIEKGSSEESSVDSQITKMLATTGDVTGREAQLAAREKALAVRESQLADRERDSIRALTDAAKQFKESCGTGGSTMIVQAPPPAAGGKYTRTEADNALTRARKIMQGKGLIPGDQWPGASLESATMAAMTKNEWSVAVSTASELLRYASEFKVDAQFVRGKIKRLDTMVKSSKRDEVVQKQLETGLSDIINQFSNNNYIAANAKLNQLFGLVR
ncbi:MAG: hypothetical protein H0V17_02095 [Deltaproteobacteria bacterium]|nr:hypothetical protein [Deltaproteobacteria bacterium]